MGLINLIKADIGHQTCDVSVLSAVVNERAVLGNGVIAIVLM